MSFANPLGIGITSEGEYFDIELKESISSAEAVSRLNAVMVEGIEVLSFRQIAEEKKMTGMAIVAAACFEQAEAQQHRIPHTAPNGPDGVAARGDPLPMKKPVRWNASWNHCHHFYSRQNLLHWYLRKT